MIGVTRMDGARMYINEQNIQWIEELPDTAITFIAGARLLVREKTDELLALVAAASQNASHAGRDAATPWDQSRGPNNGTPQP